MAKRKAHHKIAHGILLIDKPQGHSSFDVIRDLRRSTKVKKMGHTGTLDPMATGLLVLCFGEGTKLVPYLTADDKGYEAEVTFGIATDSYDADGQVLARNEPEELYSLTEEQVRSALNLFLGTQDQQPPAFSAIKVNGERLYEKARRGEDVQVPTRTVNFYELVLSSFKAAQSTVYPKAKFWVKCSKGTYIRSLAADLGKSLGIHAHLSSLRRTLAGQFKIENAHQISDITEENIKEKLTSLIHALPHTPLVELNEQAVQAVRQGKTIPCPNEVHTTEQPGLYRAQSSSGNLIALMTYEQGRLKVLRGFNLPEE